MTDLATYGGQLVPLDPDGGKDAAADGILVLLRRRGPTTREALECWLHERHDLNTTLATLVLFERGGVDFSWSDASHEEVLISLVADEEPAP